MRGKTDINQLHINCTNCTMTKESLFYSQAHLQSPTRQVYGENFTHTVLVTVKTKVEYKTGSID
ncbi:hypothetical protein CSW08_08270 [Confluentibacter flavum]|uniref:Uncharacterized protein n=1 Tax=Confluentibacter flavum TaxID=1909700 RepID=A0A2N3HK80_9FLAO|nr:hypothetical protein CSW08_08270 [Confluentibacter flavum]